MIKNHLATFNRLQSFNIFNNDDSGLYCYTEVLSIDVAGRHAVHAQHAKIIQAQLRRRAGRTDEELILR
jgi:hypothetical protein